MGSLFLVSLLTRAQVTDWRKWEYLKELKNVKYSSIVRISNYYYADINLIEKLDKYIDFIKKETLSDSLIFEKTTDDITNLNGIDVYLDVKRV